MTACDDDTRPRESKVVTAVVVGERENKQQLADMMERIKRKQGVWAAEYAGPAARLGDITGFLASSRMAKVSRGCFICPGVSILLHVCRKNSSSHQSHLLPDSHKKTHLTASWTNLI